MLREILCVLWVCMGVVCDLIYRLQEHTPAHDRYNSSLEFTRIAQIHVSSFTHANMYSLFLEKQNYFSDECGVSRGQISFPYIWCIWSFYFWFIELCNRRTFLSFYFQFVFHNSTTPNVCSTMFTIIPCNFFLISVQTLNVCIGMELA